MSTNRAESRMVAAHIAFFVKHLAVGGLQRKIVELANEFARRGHTVDLVLAKGSGALSHELEPGVRLVALTSSRMWSAVPRFVRYAREARPAVVLAAGWQVNLVAIWARMLSRARFRLVVSVRTNPVQQAARTRLWYAPFSLIAIRMFYPFADAIICVSSGIVDDLRELSVRVARKAVVVYNPVIPGVEVRSRERLTHPWFEVIDDDVPVVVAVGRMDPQKNFSLLLRAFARLTPQQDARLLFIGDGKERRELEALASTLGLHGKVEFAGLVKNPFKYMARASLLVLSSDFEGFPNVILEALACGCPVVSTDCPSGPREILEEGKWGRLVPVRNETALAEAISQSLAEQHDREWLRQRAAEFSMERAAEEYLNVLCPPGVGGASLMSIQPDVAPQFSA